MPISVKSTKISFRVSDPEVEKILLSKKRDGQMSAYINEALAFYNNAFEFAEVKQMLIQIRYTLAKMENAQKL